MWQVPIGFIYCIFFIDLATAFFFLVAFLKSRFGIEKFFEAKNYEVTFVLPAYNLGNLLERTIKSLRNSDYPKEKIRIIIVDDASQDNTFEIAKQLSKKYSGVEAYTKKHGGKAEAVNFGIKKAKTEFIVVLDADTLVKKDLLKKAMARFSDPAIAAVTCRLKFSNNQNFIGRMQDVEYTFTGFYRMIMGRLSSLPVTPAFTIFRREFFLKHGYFDSNNITEDFEMGLRIQSKHYNIGFVSDSYALTEGPSTLKSFIRQRLRWGYGTIKNCINYKRLFFNKKYGDLGVFIMPVWFIGMLLVSFMFLLGVYSAIYQIVHFINLFLVGWRPEFSFDSQQFIFLLTDLRIMLFILSILLGLTIYFIVRSELKSDIKLKDYILFLAIYLWVLAFTSVISFGYFLARKKPNW